MDELSWAAGLFEGEGCIYREKSGRVKVQMGMTERSSLDRFLAAVGAGKIYGPYGAAAMERRDGHKRKPIFMYVASGEAAHTVLALIEPLLSPWRRREAT